MTGAEMTTPKDSLTQRNGEAKDHPRDPGNAEARNRRNIR